MAETNQEHENSEPQNTEDDQNTTDTPETTNDQTCEMLATVIDMLRSQNEILSQLAIPTPLTEPEQPESRPSFTSDVSPTDDIDYDAEALHY